MNNTIFNDEINLPSGKDPYETINNSLEQDITPDADKDEMSENQDQEQDGEEYDEEDYDDEEYDEEEDNSYDVEDYENEEYNKWKYSILGGLVFFILSSPVMYKLVNVLFNNSIKIINNSGCPTTLGLLIHSLVYVLIIRAMMNLNI